MGTTVGENSIDGIDARQTLPNLPNPIPLDDQDDINVSLPLFLLFLYSRSFFVFFLIPLQCFTIGNCSVVKNRNTELAVAAAVTVHNRSLALERVGENSVADSLSFSTFFSPFFHVLITRRFPFALRSTVELQFLSMMR